MKMDKVFEQALRRELTQLPTAKKMHHRRRITFTLVGTLGLLGVATVSIANLRPAAEVVTMPIAPPVVLQGSESTLVQVPLAPEKARYLKIELACFNSKICAFAEQESVYSSTTPTIIERASLPLSNWYDPEDQSRIAPIDPSKGIQVRVDQGATWRMYAIYTEELNPKSAQLPDDPAYGSGMIIGIPNNIDYQGQMFIPIQASNGKLGWINYNALMTAVPGTIKVPFPVFGIDGKTTIGSIDLR